MDERDTPAPPADFHCPGRVFTHIVFERGTRKPAIRLSDADTAIQLFIQIPSRRLFFLDGGSGEKTVIVYAVARYSDRDIVGCTSPQQARFLTIVFCYIRAFWCYGVAGLPHASEGRPMTSRAIGACLQGFDKPDARDSFSNSVCCDQLRGWTLEVADKERRFVSSQLRRPFRSRD
jgi:hypothetical protein